MNEQAVDKLKGLFLNVVEPTLLHTEPTFSKGTLLYPKAGYWYLSGTY